MSRTNMVSTAIESAGSQEALAGQLGVSQQAVSKWLRRGWMPPERAREVEVLHGIPRKQLMNPRIVDLVDSNVYAELGG